MFRVGAIGFEACIMLGLLKCVDLSNAGFCFELDSGKILITRGADLIASSESEALGPGMSDAIDCVYEGDTIFEFIA